MDVLALGYDLLFKSSWTQSRRRGIPAATLGGARRGDRQVRCDLGLRRQGVEHRDSDPQFGSLTFQPFQGLKSGLELYRSNERTPAMWWEMLEIREAEPYYCTTVSRRCSRQR